MATAKFVAVTGTASAEALLRDIGGPLYKRVVYGGLDDTAKHAQRGMAEIFEREIEGGPARFTKITPGQRSSSVLVREARRVGDRIESGLNVNRLQSAYLKYLLGDATERRPGDVGSARAFNFIPMVGERQRGGFSLVTDESGNLGKQALKKLTRAAQSQRDKDNAKLKKTLKRDATADEFDQLRKDRQAGRKRKRRVDARVGKKSAIYFGPVGTGGAVGYWERFLGGKRQLLVMGVKLSRYDKPYLRPAWDRTVTEAGQHTYLYMQERLRRELAKVG